MLESLGSCNESDFCEECGWDIQDAIFLSTAISTGCDGVRLGGPNIYHSLVLAILSCLES